MSYPARAEGLVIRITSQVFSSAFLYQLLSLSALGPSFPPPFPVSWEISCSALCVGFAPKQTKRVSERRSDSVTFQFITSYTHALFCFFLFVFFFIGNVLHSCNAHFPVINLMILFLPGCISQQDQWASSMINVIYYRLIEFNGISTWQELFYPLRL